MKPYKLHPQAKSDLLSASEYYERESWALAGRFVVEMNRLVQEVCSAPGVHRIFTKLREDTLPGVFRTQ